MDMSVEPYNTLGFLFVKSHPKDLNEYSDFYYKNWEGLEIADGLRFGVLPSGLILRSPISQLLVVMQSKIYPLTQELKIIKK